MTTYNKELSGNTRLYPPTPAYRYIWVSAESFQVPTTKPASLVDYGIGHAWEFSDGTDDTLYGKMARPTDVDINYPINLCIGWSTPTANAGNCRWQLEYVIDSLDSPMDASADATLVDDFAASSEAAGLVQSLMGDITVPEANVCMTIRIKRRADEVEDTLGEANHLHGMLLKYVSTSRGTDI